MQDEDLVEDQDTILELIGKIQELQNEITCMNDSKDFQDAESIRSGQSHVTSRPVSFPPHPILGGMQSRSIGMPKPQRRAAKHLGHAWYIGKRFSAGPVVSSTAPYPQELNSWSSGREEPIHSSTVEKNENQTPVQDQRCQSGPAKNSVIPSEGILQRMMGQTNNDCRFQIFILTNSPRQPRLLVGR